MNHKKLIPFIVKVSVLGYFPLSDNGERCMKRTCSNGSG